MITILNGVTVTGEGSSVEVPKDTEKITVDVYFTNDGGSVTALTVVGEGSLDDDKFYSLGTHVLDSDEITAKKAMFHIIEKGIDYFRANITTITETGTTLAYVRVEFYGRT